MLVESLLDYDAISRLEVGGLGSVWHTFHLKNWRYFPFAFRFENVANFLMCDKTFK